LHEFVTPASLVSQSNSTDVRPCFTRAHLCSLTHDCIVRLSTAKQMFTRFACSRLLTRVSTLVLHTRCFNRPSAYISPPVRYHLRYATVSY